MCAVSTTVSSLLSSYPANNNVSPIALVLSIIFNPVALKLPFVFAFVCSIVKPSASNVPLVDNTFVTEPSVSFVSICVLVYVSVCNVISYFSISIFFSIGV